MKSRLFENTNQTKRHLSKAFLITGGTEEAREKKSNQLMYEDRECMTATYKTTDELVVIFSCEDSDFKNMTFDEAKALAGTEKLPSNHSARTFDFKAKRFGVIDVTDLVNQPSYKF
ncbi:TPA: hypothetical protein ACT96X_003037 [Legionella pneumophila]|uniref:hypothetical protein n=1 Tax=Legionella pneumophila TaxID=446 RepID=UPI0007872A73|nr:hypothetical protein [Legionella pneumophila]MDW9168913.1 hypothetical protein [Legionella pneumophila subsp. fraseri]MDX1847838.1 hypothetical protein [Legionella pneumophila subsp. fraseri]HAT1658615.1 hypothetical protein [Legionella pneumophila]HAT1773581.1 hypothetical protein [Legionella pneumophila]HAT2126805.1 hypothetical protein [Legionella pneumophila]